LWKTPGLTEALADHFCSHIDCLNQNDGEGCPGAETCRETRGKPLWKHPDTPEEDVCRGCPFLPTKPEAVPDDIAESVGTALSLSELKRSGARFDYPKGLSAVEWACLKGLTRGSDRAEGLKQDRDRKEARKKRKPSNG
jgi:hypothetical protein